MKKNENTHWIKEIETQFVWKCQEVFKFESKEKNVSDNNSRSKKVL